MPFIPANLNIASGIAINTALSNLKSTYNGNNAWQNTANNRYILDTVTKIKTDFRAGTLDNQEAINYIATSVCIHCFNGWNYLSTAINALIEGDYGNAIHNAYYAELRGIMSILSSQGIGIFNGFNLIIDQNGIPYEGKRDPTHTFAKEAFDEWLKIPANSDIILELFTIDNSTLKDWIDVTGFSSTITGELAATKLQQWSLDLNIINSEQKFRNFVSYNPQCFDLSITRTSDSVKDRLEFIIDLWKLCSPNELFAKSILRNSYENLYQGIYDINNLDLEVDWKVFLSNLGKNPEDQNSLSLIRFLRRQTSPTDNLVFQYANSHQYSIPVLERDTDPIGIISRACLILLINTKLVESILRLSGTSKNDLKFWFDNVGLKSGYWNAGNAPALYSDLWEDVKIEIEDIESWINAAGTQFTPYNFKNNLNNSLNHIRSLGKACLWNVGYN